MADKRKGFLYVVRGYGDHVESRTVKFTKKLAMEQVCNWCGVVSVKAEVLSCLHLVCEECRAATCKAPAPVCLIDKKTLLQDFTEFRSSVREVLKDQTVRCVYEDKGCDFVGSLYDLNAHMGGSCAYHLVICSKCKGAVTQKDMKGHLPTCERAAGARLDLVDAQSLLEDMENTHKELEQALEAASAPVQDQLEDAINFVMEQFDRLRKHLALGVQGGMIATPAVDSGLKG